MLSTHELSCQRGRQQLWGNLNLEVAPGELLFVKGANGNGKTSLLKILAGLLSPDHGQVLWQQQASQQRQDYQQRRALDVKPPRP